MWEAFQTGCKKPKEEEQRDREDEWCDDGYHAGCEHAALGPPLFIWTHLQALVLRLGGIESPQWKESNAIPL